jgi:nucleoside-diphosphate-sugar epimerase
MARYEYAEVYALAGDVGGLGHIATGQHDAEIMTNSTRINLAVLEAARRTNPGKIFFASSQCVYPSPAIEVDPFANERIVSELDLLPKACKESDASFNTFPFAQEKLFAEALYQAYARDHGINVRIGRFGNTYGAYGTWEGSRAKVVAALCRKVAQASYAGVVDIWGNGQQTRSFTYVDDAVEGMIRLMASGYDKPVNLASSEEVTIEQLFETICRTAGKVIAWKPTPGPTGVRSRNSDNTLCKQVLDWEPSTPLFQGLLQTYPWIARQVLTSHPELTTL